MKDGPTSAVLLGVRLVREIGGRRLGGSEVLPLRRLPNLRSERKLVVRLLLLLPI